MPDNHDPFGARQTIDTPLGKRVIYRLDSLAGLGDIEHLPYSIKVLLESALRNHDGRVVRDADVESVAQFNATNVGEIEIPFKPGRVVLQDFTGVPAVVDLAAMRDAIVRMTGDAKTATKVNPLVPCDLVIDHSVQVDAFASAAALTINGQKEFERNIERYTFLKWGQQAFDNFSVVPPATGIVHQVNLEYLAKVVWDHEGVLYPDSLVGTDSHTTMINGLGVVGWGVGGIEAEAVMLGQPIYMLIPEVVGFKLTGKLCEGATATDLVLRVTQMLREHGVVGKFVEFFGPGLAHMPLANRATLANMAPEYGATIGFFPVDEQTTKYMRLSGRARSSSPPSSSTASCKACGEMRPSRNHLHRYARTRSRDGRAVARRAQAPAGSRRPCGHEGAVVKTDSTAAAGQRSGSAYRLSTAAGVEVEDQTFELGDGDVVIAAITTCTNTSNPDVMIGAGLVARKATARGLTRKPWVKTSLAPGSKVVTEYLSRPV